MKRICKICFEPEEAHHTPEWIEQPDGCVCDIGTWDYHNMAKLPPACEEYIGDGIENCTRCEHDKDCHKSTV